ncbi:SURF1-like protein [Seminavis robusta]|uniref:SURF1-like protein n=1 Tax=Seminavis robusta TaxID=568900 RepID=A0A9N8EQ34_9STRA|nr:SURF1-like protein [Seminavis robusta]|eukprot:Sro1325_g262900.1 SURF1-like protein (296) ;mRNA; f:13172-14167
MAAAPQQALSSGGKVLFGSLCAGTFVLGVWQTQRFFEKQVLTTAREEQMQQAPLTSLTAAMHLRQETPFRRWQVTGQFVHKGEVLVGPRGLPPGALPKKTTPSRGVMGDSSAGTGPQGYFVVTPFEITEEDATSKSTRTVLVNRGWIPKEFIDQTTNTKGLWSRPEGSCMISAIPIQFEEPKWLKPQHDFSKRPLRLIFYDGDAFKVVLEQIRDDNNNPRNKVTEEEESLILLTQIKDTDHQKDVKKLAFPLQSPADQVGEYKISPLIHAGYATTWFGLSGAGLYMTRKLLTRGR